MALNFDLTQTGEKLQEIIDRGDDKDYAPTDFSGMGRVFLSPNIQEVDGEDKNILTQDVFCLEDGVTPRTNTIYIIQYDYDLNGAEITIPEGCVLEFNGGSLSNGTIIGQSTNIDAGIVKVFGTDITLSGSWNAEHLYPQWFGAIGDGETDDTEAVNATLKAAVVLRLNVRFPDGTYKCNAVADLSEIYGSENLTYDNTQVNIKISGSSSNTVLTSDSGITLSIKGSNNSNKACLFKFLTLEQLTFKGNVENDGSALWFYFSQHMDLHDIKIFDYKDHAIIGEYFEDANLDTFDIIGICNSTGIQDDEDSSVFYFKEAYWANSTDDNPQLAQNNAIKIVNSRFESFASAIYAKHLFDATITNCKFEKTKKNTSDIRPIHLESVRNINFNNCYFTYANYGNDSGLGDAGKPYVYKAQNTSYVYNFVNNCTFMDCIFQSSSISVNWFDVYDFNIISCNIGGFHGYNDNYESKAIILRDNCKIMGTTVFTYFVHILNIEGNNNFVDITLKRLTSGHVSDNVVVALADNTLYGNVINIDDISEASKGVPTYIELLTNDDENGIVNLKNNIIKIKNNHTSSIREVDDESITHQVNNYFFPQTAEYEQRDIFSIKYIYNGYKITLLPKRNDGIVVYKGEGNIKKEGSETANKFMKGQPVTIEFVDGVGYLDSTANYDYAGSERPTLNAVAFGFRMFDSNISRPIWWDGNRYINADGYSVALSRGTTANRPKGIAADGGVLKPATDNGFRYYDVSIGKTIFARDIDATTGEVTWITADGRVVNNTFGTTQQRPTLTQNYDNGFCYLDTTLGKPVWWLVNDTYPNGTWVDASGEEV